MLRPVALPAPPPPLQAQHSWHSWVEVLMELELVVFVLARLVHAIVVSSCCFTGDLDSPSDTNTSTQTPVRHICIVAL